MGCCLTSKKNPLLSPKNKIPIKTNNVITPLKDPEAIEGEETITLTGRCEYCNKIFQKKFEGKWRGNYPGDIFCSKECANNFKARVYSVSV